jgi:class 3 adenylate cyclase/predicted ATPase
MRCSKCGSDNREGRRFCRSCGSKLNTVCPKCGAANEPDENFCGDCGTGLAPESKPLAVLPTDEKFGVKEAALASVDGERKTVTALFADLKGSTELEQDLDPEEAREIVDPALKLMIDAVRRYDGYIVQSTGDGVFALFGAPIAHEDHPQRALYAALRMQEDLQRYSARLRETGNLPLEARVGANTGEVVVRSIATGHEQTEYTPIGHTTNLASRMQALAPTGSIAISEATRKLVEGFFALKPLGPTRVKGVNEPVNVYQVTGLGPLRTRLQRAAGRGLTKFVGREREMAALAHAAERTKSGHGEIVAAMAEAGAGKSRLFFEFKAKHQSGWMVLETFSVSHGKASAYLPVIELLHGYFGIEGADDARKRREKVAGRIAILDRALEDTLPYLCALLSIVEGDDPLAQMDGQLKKRRTLDAIKRILLRESLSQPLMVIFEDLHWIDEETQGLLNLLADSIANTKILLLVNYRPQYSHNWNSKTYYMQLRLDPLGEESAEEMLSALLGDGLELSQLKRVITEKTEGNPFFMVETVQVLLDEGALVRNGVTKLTKPIAALKIPPTVQAILASRIDRLSQDAKELLQSLAVIGREFPLSLIRAVGSKPDVEINQLLDDLRLSEFIYEQPAIGDSEYIFKHALTQEVAYNSILLERRKHLHEAIGAGLERLYANSIDDHLEALAHHYSRSGNVPRSLEYLERAGQQAVQRSAYYEAMRHFSSALELLQRLPQMAERDQRELALQTSLGQVLMTIKGWAAPETEKVFLRVTELARASGTPEQRFSALVGWFAHAYVGGRISLARDCLKETLEFIKDHPEPVFVLETCHHEWSLALSTGELDAAQRHVERGLALYETRLHSVPVPLYSAHHPAVCGYGWGALVLWLRGFPDAAQRHANQAVRLSQELRDSLSLTYALGTKAQLHQFRRDVQSALTTAEAAIAKAEEVGFPYFSSHARVVKGWALAELARADEALGEIREAIAVLSASHTELCFTLALATLATVCSGADYIDEGLEAVTDALLRIEHDGERCWEAEIHRLRGELLLRQSDSNLVPAKSCFERAIQIASRQGAKSLQLRTTMSLGRLLASQGYREDARVMLGEIYNWFTEGLDTADLKEAKALLDELSR